MRISRDSLIPFYPSGGGAVGMGCRLGEQEDEQRVIGGQEWDGGDEGRDLWLRGRNLWLRIFRFWSREREILPRGRNLWLRIFRFWSREREFWGCGAASRVWFLTFRRGRSGGGVSVGPGFRLFLNGEPLLLQRQPREVC